MRLRKETGFMDIVMFVLAAICAIAALPGLIREARNGLRVVRRWRRSKR
jgi:hypothetical protein